MQSLYQTLTAAQRGAALVANDTFKGNDFMGWCAEAAESLRCPADLSPSLSVINHLYCNLGALATLTESTDGHSLSNRPQLAAECRGARRSIAKGWGFDCLD
jgi:hypothetical protein